VALYRYAVRDEFATPLEPSTVEELEWFFRERQGKAQTAPPGDLDLATAARGVAPRLSVRVVHATACALHLS
jgi:hypothetical protein